MQNTFKSFVNTYAQQYEFPCVFSNDDLSVQLDILDFPVYIALQAEIDSLVISCELAPVPQKNKEKVYAELLKLNNLFIGSKMCTLGLDSQRNLITLQTTWPMHELNAESFETLINNFLELVLTTCEDLRYDFLNWQYNEEFSKDEDMLSQIMHMVRV